MANGSRIWKRSVTSADPFVGLLEAAGTENVVVLAAVHGTIAMARPQLARPLAIAGLVSSLAMVVFATALVP